MNVGIRLVRLVAVGAVAGAALGQTPAPRDLATIEIDGKKISIDYGRPALNGRNIDELLKRLPAGGMWRAGSEQVTTLTTETDLMVAGKKVAAGKYSLYVHCPESGEFSVVVNRDLGQPLGEIWDQAPDHLAKEPWPRSAYEQQIGSQEVVRAPMKGGTESDFKNRFTIALVPLKKGAILRMSWGNQSWSADLYEAQ